jgi:D-alanine-D-alanine ligase
VAQFEALQAALEKALEEDDEAIVERYIKGTEVTCGLMKGPDGFKLFPITEIIPENEFFDYEAKYTKGKAQEITPARIDREIAKECQETAMEIYSLCNCSGIIRVDFILKGKQVYFLELNSIPGMSEESIIPKQVRSMGLRMEFILQQVIDEVLDN